MDAPKRIQRKRTKGWKMPEGVVYVGRPTRYGNPFVIGGWYRWGSDSTVRGTAGFLFTRVLVDSPVARIGYTELKTAEQACEWYRQYLEKTNQKFEELSGKNLACWCKEGAPCHADILLEFANKPTP